MATTIDAVLFINLIDEMTGSIVSAVMLAAVILIPDEISPKSLTRESPERFAVLTIPSLEVLRMVLIPLNFLSIQWKRPLFEMFRRSTNGGITEGGLVTLVDQTGSEDDLDQHESELIWATTEFHNLKVGETLTPRADIVAVRDTDSMKKVAKIFVKNGCSRLPVYHGDVDSVIGVIHEKDFHAARYRGLTSVEEILDSMLYTTGNTKISELLRTLQRKKAHVVIVADEYDGTEGLATLEDIVKELVGKIWDGHDGITEGFKKQEGGSYLISCLTDLTDLFDLSKIRGECDSDTIPGWVVEQIDQVPEEDDRFVSSGPDVTVTKVDRHRTLEIRVEILSEKPDNRK